MAHRSRHRRLLSALLLALVLATQLFAAGSSRAAPEAAGPGFVRRAGATLQLNGRRFRFAGANNYYPIYKSQAMVDDLLTTAAANKLNVLRVWGSLDIGNPDGSNSVDGGPKEGVYFQYWDAAAGAPAYNDGDDGLKRLDYVIHRARQLGIRLVIPFVNNWNAFGGMDQYVRWRGGTYHDEFYTDPVIRGWYKAWIAHLLNRTNSYNGIKYKNDPTIMMWELANEPRCKSAGAYPQSSSCTTRRLLRWAADVSAYVKTLDRNHLLAVGDEGFYCDAEATDWTMNCLEGVDTLALTRLPAIDVMSLHLYPDHWGKTPAWGTWWIRKHIRDGHALGKPVVLGEFGLLDKNERNPVYKRWTDAVLNNGGDGALFWILSGKQDDGSLYPDYDGFTISCPTPMCTAMKNFALRMKGRPGPFAPVADDNTAQTEFETPLTLQPLANDIAYQGATIVSGTLDLDPATEGLQQTVVVTGGTFLALPDASVVFTPTADFAGKAEASYVVSDGGGLLSNIARIVVTVKPDPTGALLLFSFESGTEGWALGNWQQNAGAVSQSADYASAGSMSLRVDAPEGSWYGASFGQALDLSTKTVLKFDLKTGAAGTSQIVALKLGDSWQWCQSSSSWVNADTTTTVAIDLLSLGCASYDLSKVHEIYVWFSPGTFYMDAVRAE